MIKQTGIYLFYGKYSAIKKKKPLIHGNSMYLMCVICGCSVAVSDSLWLHGLQHTRLPCPSLFLRICSNSCPLSQWCHPTIMSSVAPFCLWPCTCSFPNPIPHLVMTLRMEACVSSMRCWSLVLKGAEPTLYSINCTCLFYSCLGMT